MAGLEFRASSAGPSKVFPETMPAFDQTLAPLKTGLETATGREIADIHELKSSGRQSSSIRQLRVTFTDRGSLDVWAKTLHGSRDSTIKQARTARDFDLHTLLHASFESGGPFRVPKPLFHSPEDRLIVTEHCHGHRLQDKIERLGRGFPRAGPMRELEHDCHRAGEWLRAFQAATRDHAPGVLAGLPAQKPKESAQIVELAMHRLDSLLARSPAALGPIRRDALVGVLHDRLASSQRQAANPPSSIHGDFFPGNLLVAPDSVCGIDFSSATWGSRWFDLSYFVFQLETLATKPWFRRKTIAAFADAFLQGYDFDGSYREFWSATPGMEILHVSHCVARLLSLSENTGGIGPRALYRWRLMHRTRRQLALHLRPNH